MSTRLLLIGGGDLDATALSACADVFRSASLHPARLVVDCAIDAECSAASSLDAVDAVLCVSSVPRLSDELKRLLLTSRSIVLLNAPWLPTNAQVDDLATTADALHAVDTVKCTVLCRQIVSSERNRTLVSDAAFATAQICALDVVTAAHLQAATVEMRVASDGAVWIASVSPVPTLFGDDVAPTFFGLLAYLACATAEMPIGLLPTLRQWRAVLAEDWKRALEDDVPHGSLAGFLRARYDVAHVAERREAIRQVIRDAVDRGFDLDAPTCVVASPGRNRVFMGHTDLLGLGGPTINGATREELFGVAQSDAAAVGQLCLTNSDAAFASCQVDVAQVALVAADEAKWRGTKVFDAAHWQSYVCGALAFMLAPHKCRGAAAPLLAYFRARGIRVHIGAVGAAALSHSGGVSSSAALTGAVTSCVRALTDVPMTLGELTSVDLGEYLLGKMAGSADKTAQMMARRGRLCVVGSLPDRFLASVELPADVAVLMADCDVPRLTTAAGSAYLARVYGDDRARRSAVATWASTTMSRNSARVFVLAVRLLVAALGERDRCLGVGLSDADRAALRAVLQSPSSLLRELCAGGALASAIPSPPKRHALLYRMLKLLPLTSEEDSVSYAVRQATLYGLAEVERGDVYVKCIANANQLSTILRLVRTAHDGDRAFVDDRTMAATPWSCDARVCVDDATLDRLSAACEAASGDDATDADCLLHWQPGAFQRSLACIDERADQLRAAFGGRAELRVAAAGLGGSVAVHCDRALEASVAQLLQSWNWSVRAVQAAAQTQLFIL
jgi:galactokinase